MICARDKHAKVIIIPNDVIVDDSKNWLATIFSMSLAGDLMHYRMLGNMNTLIMKWTHFHDCCLVHHGLTKLHLA